MHDQRDFCRRWARVAPKWEAEARVEEACGVILTAEKHFGIHRGECSAAMDPGFWSELKCG
jgi:hypothetical protein